MEQYTQVDKPQLGVYEESTVNGSSVRSPPVMAYTGYKSRLADLQVGPSRYVEKIFTVPGLNYRKINIKKRHTTS